MAYSRNYGISTNMGEMRDLNAPFVLGFVVLYSRAVIGMQTLISIPKEFDQMLFLFGMILMLAHILSRLDRYGKRWLVYLLALGLLAYCYIVSGETAPISAATIVIASATVGETKPIVRLWALLTISVLSFLVVTYIISLLIDPDSVSLFARTVGVPEKITRHAFYLIHPNMAGAMLMMAYGAFLYLHYGKIDIRHMIGALVLAGCILVVTDSRTSSALTLMMAVLFWLQKKKRLLCTKQGRAVIGLAPVLLFASVALIAGPLYSPTLGSLFTGRVSLWHACLENQGFTLLGQPFVPTEAIGTNGWRYHYNTLDCMYASGLFVYGIAFVAMVCTTVFQYLKNPDPSIEDELPIIAITLAFGITESHALNYAISFGLIFMGRSIKKAKCNNTNALSNNLTDKSKEQNMVPPFQIKPIVSNNDHI